MGEQRDARQRIAESLKELRLECEGAPGLAFVADLIKIAEHEALTDPRPDQPRLMPPRA